MAKSRYQAQSKSMRGGKRKKFQNSSPVWLKARHRVRRKMLR